VIWVLDVGMVHEVCERDSFDHHVRRGLRYGYRLKLSFQVLADGPMRQRTCPLVVLW